MATAVQSKAPVAVQSQGEEVLYAVADHIATITLNRPDRMNTISGPMLNQLTQHLLKADADRDVRVVILTGTGRAFCAGLDLTEVTRPAESGGITAGAGNAVDLDLRNTPPTVLFNMDTPTICALNGSAAGYGMDTALGCDIRLMAKSAKIARGLHQTRHRTGKRRHLVPAPFGRLVEGGRADLHRPHAHRRRVRRDGPGLGRRRERRPRRRRADTGPGDRRQRAPGRPGVKADDADGSERDLQRSRPPRLSATPAALMRSKDAAEGMRAFMEKRPAEFTGR